MQEQGAEATAWSVNMTDEFSNLQVDQITTSTVILKWNSTIRKFDNSSMLVLSSQFPCFCIFPRDVDRVIHVQQKAFASIQKSKTKNVVIQKRKFRPHNNVQQTEPAMAFCKRDLGAG